MGSVAELVVRKQNQSAEGFIASEKLGAETAAASKAAAEESMREIAKAYKDKGERQQ